MLSDNNLQKLQLVKAQMNSQVVCGVSTRSSFTRTRRPSGGRPRPKEDVSRWSSNEINRSGPNFQSVSGAYDMLPIISEPSKNGAGRYIGARRERQIDLKNRRYQRHSSS